MIRRAATCSRDPHKSIHASLHRSRSRAHAFIAALAIATTPSYVSFPPVKPLAWQKVQPAIPLTLLNSSSLTPHHGSGSDLRFSNDSPDTGTHWILHLAPGWSSSGYRTYRTRAGGERVGSRVKRWSFHGAACSSISGSIRYIRGRAGGACVYKC